MTTWSSLTGQKSQKSPDGLTRAQWHGYFKHHISFGLIWLQTLVVINSELCLTLFPSFCAQPSEVSVLLDSNLSRCPFLRQVVDTDLLLCSGFNLEHAVLFLCHIFAQRRMNDRKIEQSNWHCLGLQQLLAYSMEISFHMKKKSH